MKKTAVTAADIDAVLPQTQCGECGYPGCLPYAQALAAGLAPIDRCPPGGIKTLQALGDLLQKDSAPYRDEVIAKTRPPAVAAIREEECIGCTKCIAACPVDAIIGSGKLLHHVLPHACTGCGLCVEPCPVDCIDMIEQAVPTYEPAVARQRHHARSVRLLRQEQAKQQIYRQKRQLASSRDNKTADKEAKQAYILHALKRVENKQSKPS